ncbi:uncharacterized protein LOC111696589 [Eurytemora carolleeae]|uniref:uncharacterized protein LOC111696589 n=1 Tax=Eurytemora carolleeae TaxID=1294199 RepID=UPI000C756E48|nr:uncharacterized protein LOC111696589 [Eurytemora carolleeae]|eukprot:XP_023321996.1 uncharacterized protein LOC111696589 [Eurytemora affinis]
MKLIIYSIGFLFCVSAVLAEEDTRNQFLNKICDKCEACKDITITGVDADGDPDFDCESKCSNCEQALCTSTPKPKECSYCRRGESVVECTDRCQRGCTFCNKTKACKN